MNFKFGCMELIQVLEHLEDNPVLAGDPLCRETLYRTIDFYKKVGFVKPWIGYYAAENGRLIGCAGYKGKPVDGKIEIAYGTFDEFRNQGIGTRICKELVDLALLTDPTVRVTARTLPENNFSTGILRKNNFQFSGIVYDPEDGDVWEWEYDRKIPEPAI